MGVESVALALADIEKVDVLALSYLRTKLLTYLQTELKGIGEIVTDDPHKMAANTIYFYLYNLTSDVALALFDLQGIQISAGSACQSGAAKNSEVLLHLHKGNSAKNGLRLSFGFDFNEDELNILVKKLGPIFSKLRSS